MNLTKLIERRVLFNTNEKCKDGDSTSITRDLVYLDDRKTVQDIADQERVCYPTDYAIMNGAEMSPIDCFVPEHRKSCGTYLRSGGTYFHTDYVSFNGHLDIVLIDQTDIPLRPAMQLNLASFINERKLFGDVFKIDKYKVGKKEYHTIEFGEYPETYVNDFFNGCLERAMSKGELKPTGKKYIGHFDDKGNPTYNEEYMLCDMKYVRVLSKKHDEDSEFSDGTKAPKNGTPLWVEVKPITWIIRNWDDMPKEINSKGNGKARAIDIQTRKAIISGIPFYPNNVDDNRSMWQNSTIRGYLNGINVNNITSNGDINYTAPNGGDFREQNFLTEAFDSEPSLINSKPAKEIIEQVVKKKERKGCGVKVLDKPMTVNEQIKFYIDNGKSFMLHGPSGVGKTRRIEEIDPDFVSIVLRNGMLPEEVIGKTIYPNNDKTKAGTWVPPAWYADLCDKCEKEPDKQHVLFIDEITNVKPSEQSLVFHLVLNNSIGPNIGKLPQNVVVVAAGNSKEESASAYNMPEPLFRRFDGHIELRPEIQTWLEWGSEESEKGEDRLKIHPLVANFVGSYGNQVFYSPYDSEDPPKYAIDPRGWEQISDIIYDNKGVIAKELIENKVGKEIASTFVAFAKTPLLSIEDILDKNYDGSDIPDSFDAKYALALSLRSASIDQIEEVREFINNELGGEILSMFDVAWVGEDNEKAIHLANLQQLKNNRQDTSLSYLQDDGK